MNYFPDNRTNFRLFEQMIEAKSPAEALKIRNILRTQIPDIEFYKKKLRSSLCDGDEAICLKASSAAILAFDDCDASIIAEHNGCSVTRWEKEFRDRRLQEKLRFANFKGAMRLFDLGIFECLEDSTPRLVVTAGMCKMIESFSRSVWPELHLPTLRNGVLSLQSGELLHGVIRSRLMNELLAVGISSRDKATLIVQQDVRLANHLGELQDRVNFTIAQIPPLAEVLEHMNDENVLEFLAEAAPFAWQWIMLSELIDYSEIQKAKLSTLGIFDPFWQFEKNYRDVFWSTGDLDLPSK